jgi:small subunit ribosomal protein S3
MGHKVNPISLRLGITENWRSRWYARKAEFGRFLVQDQRIRQHIKKTCAAAGIAKIEIERTREATVVIIHAARPGLLIGRNGVEVERLRAHLEEITGGHIKPEIKEISRPEAHAQILAEMVAEQIKKRASYKRAMKRVAEAAMETGILGVRLRCAGRLGGSEMARTEDIRIGSIPLHTLRAKVDYGFTEAVTKTGSIGIKAWTYSGVEGEEEETAHAADA